MQSKIRIHPPMSGYPPLGAQWHHASFTLCYPDEANPFAHAPGRMLVALELPCAVVSTCNDAMVLGHLVRVATHIVTSRVHA